MPYDPNWGLEDEVLNETSISGDSVFYSNSLNGKNLGRMDVEEEVADSYKDGRGLDDVEETEDMEIDLPPPDLHQHINPDPETTPKSRLPFPGAGALSRVEVVLHSSPKKDAYTLVENYLLGDYDDETTLVTSDLMLNPAGNHIREQASEMSIPPPPENKQPAATSTSTSLPLATPQPKKRGRPAGWRPGAGGYVAMRAGLPPGTVLPTPKPKPKKPTGDQPRRRGRKPAPTARQIYLKLKPHFLTFRCEWENCPAELQNLETLRKHLLIVHGRPLKPSVSPAPSSESITCKWPSCPSPNHPTRFSFASHIETAHLAPFLWHIGDGPRNSTPSATLSIPTSTTPFTTTITHSTHPDNTKEFSLPYYLFNAHGTQVTPSINTQQLESEDDRKRRQARLNKVIAQRDANAPDEPEYTEAQIEEMARVVEEKRARVRGLREYADKVRGRGALGGVVGIKGSRGIHGRGLKG